MTNGLKSLDEIIKEVGEKKYAEWEHNAHVYVGSRPSIWNRKGAIYATMYEQIIKQYDAYINTRQTGDCGNNCCPVPLQPQAELGLSGEVNLVKRSITKP